MGQYERAAAIAAFLKARIATIPQTAIVLGSGLQTFGDTLHAVTAIDYAAIPGFPTPTVPGHGGKMLFGQIGNTMLLVMQGRFHRYEGYSFDDVTLYIRVLQLLGVKQLILTNAAGAINTAFAPGDLVMIKDHISLFCDSPLFGANDERFGPRFPSMSCVYDPALCRIAETAAAKVHIPLSSGIYCYAKGPMYETPAEIRAMRTLGADMCGMSTVPEAIIAVHSGLRVLGISCITNMAAGVCDCPPTHEEVLATGQKAAPLLQALLTAICEEI